MDLASAGPQVEDPALPAGSVLSNLLAKSLLSCCAAREAGGEEASPQIRVTLEQCPDLPGLLLATVADDGLGGPEDEAALQAFYSSLAGPLASSLIKDSRLAIRTATAEDSMLRLYTLCSAAAADNPLLLIQAAGNEPKPGGNFHGTECQLGIKLHSVDPEAVLCCAEELLRRAALASPPVRVGLHVKNVLLRDATGAREPMSGSQAVVGLPSATLTPTEQLEQGLAAAEFPDLGTPGAALGAAAPAATTATASQGPAVASSGTPPDVPLAVRSAAGPSRGSGSRAGGSAVVGGDGTAQHAAQQQQQQQQPEPPAPPMLTLVGVGEAGWGCEGAAEQYRGCRWTARAGLVLRLPDHTAPSEAAAVQQPPAASQLSALDPAQPLPQGAGLQAVLPAGPSQRAASATPGPRPTAAVAPRAAAHVPSPRAPPAPLCLFRNCAPLPPTFSTAADSGSSQAPGSEQQERALRAAQRVDWREYGLHLEGASLRADRGGALVELRLGWAQPKSGAQLVGGVVHLQACEVRTEAQTGKPWPLSALYEERMVRAALEGALRSLKAQAPPGMLANRRERSLYRAGPSLLRSVAGIIRRSRDGEFLEQSLATLDCPDSESLEQRLDELLIAAVNARTAQQAEAAGERSAERRQRTRQTAGGDD